MDKILVVQTAFIGDAVLTLPMIQKLKDKHPQSEIDVLAIPETAEIFSASPFVGRVIQMDKKGRHKSFFQMLKFVREIKKNEYNFIYSPHRSLRTSLIVMMLGVRETAGFNNSSLKHVYKTLIDYKTGVHEVQRNLDLINYNYSDDSWRIIPALNIPDAAKEKLADFFKSNNLKGKLAAVAPGSVWETKRYPPEYFEGVIRYLLSRRYSVILIGSEKEKALCENIAGKFSDGVLTSAGVFTILETVELLKRAEILISNDSAPAHFGMCADIPVLTIYCSTIPEFGFYPFNKKSTYVSLEGLSCKPCGIHGHNQCPVKNFACGMNLKPEYVISKIREMIND